MECVFSQRAEDDLDAIAEFIAVDNPARALSYIRDMRARCDTITQLPGAAMIVDRIDDVPVRKVNFGNYRIYYTWLADQDVVFILHIRHMARQLPRFSE